jgi:DNA-binding response OmpR family regulator
MKRILITEDDALLANIYCEKCRSEGFDVTIAPDGNSAIEELKRNPPDLLLLDLMLPGTDGVQIIRFIRGQAGMEKLPILVLSNAYVTTMVQAAWRAGADKCLTKSTCTPRQMIGEVRALLEAGRQERAASGTRIVEGASQPDAEWLIDKADVFQASVREQFLRQGPRMMGKLRAAFQGVTEHRNANAATNLLEVYRAVHALGGAAGLARFGRIAQMCSALEALVRELHDKPKKLNASSLRTIAQALDFIGTLFEREIPDAQANGSPLILVVDDELISRETVCAALEKASLRALSVDDPLVALKLLEQNRFDLVFMDVEMPGLNGFELCKKLHELESNRNTPVVFVTSLQDFETRARSALSGGVDLIGKPFLMIELAVKALPYVFRSAVKAAEAVACSAKAA